jgi:DegV family protein with EDD domain
MLHLVTDSTSDLLAEEARALGVTVVPLTVRFGDEQFRDGIDIDAAAFYQRLTTSPVTPTTSQPSPEDFAGVYRKLLVNDDDEIVSVHIAAKLSGTMQSATLAARDLPEGRVHVVDSESVSAGIQLLLRQAAHYRDDGLDAARIVQNLEVERQRVIVYVLLDTLTYLQKGGRIGRAQAFLGSVLNVRPLLQIRESEVEPVARVRSRQQGMAKMVELVQERCPLQSVSMMHSTALEGASELRSRLVTMLPEMDIALGQLGPVVGTYSGPGAIGVATLSAG